MSFPCPVKQLKKAFTSADGFHEVLRDSRLPERGSEDAAGWDVYACLEEALVVPAWGRVKVPTGLAFAVPVGYEMQIRPRSGLALKHGVTVINAPGTLDADYRGELFIALVNLSGTNFAIQHHDRVAQLVFAKHEVPEFSLVDDLEKTARGEGGFGSTGT